MRTMTSSVAFTASTPGGVFCGESMFYKQPNASKLALLFLIDHLRTRDSTWLDAQVMTPHIKALGAKEISRAKFTRKLIETNLFIWYSFDMEKATTRR
jgi:leucyl/phenylalanyl-tRNA--protein transferase